MINLPLIKKYWSKNHDYSSKFFSMKKVYLVLFIFFISFSLPAATYYVSTNGSNSNNGTINQPFASWQKAVDVAVAGDIIYIRGGVYNTSGTQRTTGYCGLFIQNKNGTSSNRISILAYPGEVPILDCSGMTQQGYDHIGISIESSSYLILKGLRIRNVRSASGKTATGISTYNMNNSTLELLAVSGTQGPGFGINGNNNLLLNCDSYDNYDSHYGGEHADGFIFGRCEGRHTNTLRGCRAWNNSDDGFDSYGNEGTIIWENCWSFRNGYGTSGDGAGFKLGATRLAPLSTTQKILVNCLSANNKGIGFDQSEGNILIHLFNNTSYNNSRGFEFSNGGNLALVFKNNISYSNRNPDTFQSNMIRQNNSWQNGITVNSSDFLSLDDSGISGERNSDGSLPNIRFLHLASNSDMIDAGVDVGLPYNGRAPDLGCFESGGSTPAPAPVPVYVSSSVQNSTPSVIEIIFNLSLANTVPSPSAFTVNVNSSSRSINSVSVSGTKVSLTLSSPVVYGDVINVGYTKPSSNPLQTTSGGQVASFSSRSVTNNLSAPRPVFVSAYINNESPAWLVTTYSTELAAVTPAASAFTVHVNSVVRTISSVLVTANKVCFALSSSVSYGDVITVSYTKPSSNPVQNTSGGQLDSFSAQKVTNNVVAALPSYVSSSVENNAPSSIELTFNLPLANVVPPASAFNVQVNSSARGVNSVTVSGSKVTLALASAVRHGDNVTVSYTKPSSNPLQTSSGGQAASFPAQTVTNRVSAPAPVYTESSVENSAPARIVMKFNLTLANIVPATSAFTVTVNSAVRSISSISISGASVNLNLSSQVAYGDVITVAYTKPSSNPLQTTSGGQAASFPAQRVTNRLSAPALVFTGASVENSAPARIVMRYNVTLANVVPAVSAFKVTVNSVNRTVSSLSISGTTVNLNLSSQVAHGDIITVAYAKPSSNPLQATTGMQAESLSAQSVKNNLQAPIPVYSSSVIENASPSRIGITYSLALANIIPPPSAFRVTVNSAAVDVTNVSISDSKVFLTLKSPVKYGDVVTMSYTRPSANPIQTTAGGVAASINAQTVTNRVEDSNSPPVVIVNYDPSSYSGFVNELDASGSYDPNKDNLTFTWKIPGNIPVSATKGSKIQYLSPVVTENQKVVFTVTVSDGKTSKSKSIPVEILPYKPELEVAEVLNVEASSYQGSNYPYNILDGNLATMWAVNGDNQWLILELKDMFNVQHVKLAFHTGQKKESYFDILGSNDKENWEPILIKSNSCAFSGDMQVFDFPPSKTGKEFKYIKLVGHCNSEDTWNYISECRILGYRYRNPSSYENQIVKIFPNPASDYVNVRIEETNVSPDFIRIISLSGKILHEEKLDPGISEFTMPINLRKGIYVLQMGEGKVTLFSQKLVVNQ